jgi:hypothetical protein
VWVVAWGWLDPLDDEPDDDCVGVTEPESKNELLPCAASSLMRDESARLPLVVAGVTAPPPAWAPPRTTTETTPKPTTAAPAEATLRRRARRRAGARREEPEEEAARDMAS